MRSYHYLIVGSGLFGATFARELKKAGKKVLVIEKDDHVGGHVYTKKIHGAEIHLYGPHIFHTDSKKIWDYVNNVVEFEPYFHKVKAKYGNKIYSLPFNMSTFYELWGCTTPGEAYQEIEKQKVKIENPQNLEDWVLSQIGPDLYQTLIYGYNKKQWSKEPRKLPASLIKRLPLRFNYNDNYHHSRYSGLPVGGYTNFVNELLKDVDVQLNTDFFEIKKWQKIAKKLIYSGPIDQLFDYKYGTLEYRSLEFKHVVLDYSFQGIPQMNHTEADVPFTRTVEHKYFRRETADNPRSVVTYEYPINWEPGKKRYYPINDDRNNEINRKYQEELGKQPKVIAGGRLGTYRYLDMHMVIGQALKMAEKELS